jgi:PAS domain S-box-containing protein
VLQRSKAQLQTLFDAAPLGIYLVGADFRIRQVNPTALPIFGDIPNLIGRDFNELIHILWPQAYADELVERFRHTLETGEPDFVPERVESRRDRGVTEYYEWQINRIILPEGGYGVVCYFRDISAQVLARQAIAESEQRYRSLFNSIDQGFCIVEMIFEPNGTPIDYRFLEVNPVFEQQTGLIHAQGKRMRELAPQHEDYWFEIYGRIALTGEPARFENRAEHLQRWFDVYAFRFGEPEKRHVAILFNDITRRKSMESDLRFQSLVLGQINDAVIALDHQQRITYMNRAAERQYGVNAMQELGRPLQQVYDYRWARSEDEDEAAEALARHEFWRGENIHVRRDGTKLHVESAVNVLRNEDGTPAGMLAVIRDISERKQAEEALRQSEQRLRAIYDGTYEYIGLLAPDGTLLDANRASLAFAGNTREDVVGHPFWETPWFTSTPGAPELVRQATMRAGAGEFVRHELRIARPSGEELIFDISFHPLRNEQGEVVLIVPEGRNITTLKHAEAALRESEALLRILADTVPQVIWTNDADGRANYFNGRWYDYSGLSYDKSAVLGWQVIVHPDDAPASVERWQQALAAGGMFDTEYRLRRADGAYRWHLGRNVPLRASDGQIVGWFGTATDIEDLKQAEAARRESDERFRLLVEGARDYAMFLLDSDNRITFWSVGAERVFGWCEAEVLGQSGAIIFTPEDRHRGAIEQELRTALLSGSVVDRRWHVRKDGAHLFLDGVLIRLDDDEGQLRGFVKIGRDATVQHRAEEAVQHARDELERRVEERTAELATANQALRQEIAERKELEAQRAILMERIITAQEGERQRLAHELHDTLGQFLSALNLRLSLLESTEGIPPTVSDEFARLRALTSEIDHEVDRLTMELRPPALGQLGLAEALRSYVAQWMATSGIPVDMLITGLNHNRLAPATETTAYRIVQEVLSNVLKHAQATAVSVIVERTSRMLRVIVEDNGVGFERSQSTPHGTGGRQVGLIGMLERATLAGGELTIESAPGAGTTVYLQIPLREDTPKDTGATYE